MVEKDHTVAGHEANWLQQLYDPLRQAGRRVAEYFAPQSEAAATGESYEIMVELPGVEADDIDVSVHEQTLSLRGEKRFETEQSGRSYFFSERAYGSFQRSFRLPPDADADKVSASFRNGVLTITVPKLGEPPSGARRIAVRQE